MEKSNLITEKIQELIELAKLEGEPNVQIVLLALSGARHSEDDALLAVKVQEFIKDVLIPNIKSKQIAQVASQN